MCSATSVGIYGVVIAGLEVLITVVSKLVVRILSASVLPTLSKYMPTK